MDLFSEVSHPGECLCGEIQGIGKIVFGDYNSTGLLEMGVNRWAWNPEEAFMVCLNDASFATSRRAVRLQNFPDL